MDTTDTFSLPATASRPFVRARLAAIGMFVFALWAASLFRGLDPRPADPPADSVARGH